MADGRQVAGEPQRPPVLRRRLAMGPGRDGQLRGAQGEAQNRVGVAGGLGVMGESCGIGVTGAQRRQRNSVRARAGVPA